MRLSVILFSLFRYLLEICTNVLTCARKVVSPAGLGLGAVGGGLGSRATQIVFAPSLAEAKERPDQYDGNLLCLNCNSFQDHQSLFLCFIFWKGSCTIA